MKIINTHNPYYYSSTPNDNNDNKIPSQHHHVVALSCKSYRVFGLNDIAWSNARDEWKLNRGGNNNNSDDDDDNIEGGDEGGDDDNNEKEEQAQLTPKQLEEQREIKLICNAIITSLKEDAGGYGTAGFHMVSYYYYYNV